MPQGLGPWSTATLFDQYESCLSTWSCVCYGSERIHSLLCAQCSCKFHRKQQEFDMIKRIYSASPIVLLAFFGVVAAGLLVSGIFSYTTMVRFSRDAEKSAMPQQMLFLLGGVVHDIQLAENGVRAYRLSQNPKRLEEYYAYSNQGLERVLELSQQQDDRYFKRKDIDTLQTLIITKLEVLEAYAKLPSRQVVVSELERISRRIDSLPAPENSSGRGLGALRNLFVRDRNAYNGRDTLVAHVRDEVDKVKGTQTRTLGGIDSQELEIWALLGGLDGQIEALLEAIRLDVLQQVEDTALLREKRQLQVIRNIRVFSLLAILFLLMGGYAIVSYLRKRRHYELALVQARINAEAYSAMQERFVAHMSHEVRTPLHAVAGFAEQLWLNKDPLQQKEFLGFIRSASTHLLGVVNDILDYSKLKAGKMKLMLQPFSPLAELTQALQLFTHELEQKGLKLRVNHTLAPSVWLLGDAFRFRQVLINLLGNAVKFSRKGLITVTMGAENQPGGNKSLVVEIADTGIGMTEQQMERIFQPFEQATNQSAGVYRGTGLGLTITREIIEQQGGGIQLRSKEGAGTQVRFTLPYLEVSEPLPQAEEGPVVDSAIIRGQSILIADDEAWNRKLLVSMLQAYGAKLSLAEDGEQALELAGSQKFDGILLDIRMPGKDGLEVVKHLRQHGPNQDTRVVALTAMLHPGQKEELIQAGMNVVLLKPFSEHDILGALAPWEAGSPFVASEPLEKGDKADALNEEALFDPARIEELGLHNPAFMQDMVKLFLENMETYMQGISQAIQEGNQKQILWFTHKMAPAVRHLHAMPLLRVIKDLEKATHEQADNAYTEALHAQLLDAGNKISQELRRKYLEK